MEENTEIYLIYVVDSSFLLSTLLPDEKVLKPFQKILESFRKNETVFVSSELLKYEIGNSLKSAVIQKRLTSKKAQGIYSAFKKMAISYQEINYEQVLSLSLEYGLTFYDATYIFLSKKNKCQLLTLDKKLLKISL